MPYYGPLLDAYPMLVYNGMFDWLICMYSNTNQFRLHIEGQIGTSSLLGMLEWSGSDGWLDASNENFMVPASDPNYYLPMVFLTLSASSFLTVNKVVAGYTRKYGNLQFTILNDSGHFACFDQPAAVLELVTQFINGI